jgi:hypothetical protein
MRHKNRRHFRARAENFFRVFREEGRDGGGELGAEVVSDQEDLVRDIEHGGAPTGIVQQVE